MSFVRVWVHYVWSTKDRLPFLDDEVRLRIFNHIRDVAREKSIFIEELGGYRDHAHALISLGTKQTIDDVVKNIKGESSRWINKNQITSNRFSWQDDYFATSVSDRAVENVKRYIQNQAIHHSKMTFDEEYEDFLRRTGFRAGDWSPGQKS